MHQWIRPNAEPNVTPMIDVMLVLLIVFMVIVIQGRPAIDVQLPVPCVGSCGSGDAIVVEVLGPRSYRLNQHPVPADSLLSRLTAVYHGRPVSVLSVTGGSRATYSDVVDAIDVARSAGVKVISAVEVAR